jgi:hypothetical protein
VRFGFNAPTDTWGAASSGSATVSAEPPHIHSAAGKDGLLVASLPAEHTTAQPWRRAATRRLSRASS